MQSATKAQVYEEEKLQRNQQWSFESAQVNQKHDRTMIRDGRWYRVSDKFCKDCYYTIVSRSSRYIWPSLIEICNVASGYIPLQRPLSKMNNMLREKEQINPRVELMKKWKK